MGRKNTPADFWAKVSNVGQDDMCWEWQGICHTDGRYGSIRYQSKRWLTHRLAYYLTHGSVPSGKIQAVKHTCDNYMCCNPAHLYVFGDNIYQKLIVNKFWSNVSKNGPMPVDKPCVGHCWVWCGYTNDSGYGMISAEGNDVPAHRFSYVIAYGTIPAGMFICHKCDNRSCVRPEHLFIGTSQDNISDMVSKRRNARILTEEIVSEIRADTKHPNKYWADKYGVVVACIQKVRTGKCWRHVK